ncbi:collagen alpha-1(XIV) chain-like [Mytilus edulis]|uniref:collagen alpha-1(XIV) chain-like n=1 Tax=Mytilus edulis TaxID=6550 RepID=UPI0039EEF2CC
MFLLNLIKVLVMIATVEAYYYYHPMTTTPPMPPDGQPICNAVADIVFVYDTSGSIITDATNPSMNFDKMKEFMINIVNAFNPVGPTGTQFAALCFSRIPNIHFFLNQYGTKNETIDAINNFPTGPNLNTAIGDALQVARNQFFLPKNGGGRNCSQCFVIVITDGEQNTGNASATTEADLLRNKSNCIVYVVSVGLANSAKLTSIAGGSSNVFNVDSFALLNTTVNAVVQAACNDSKCTTAPVTPAPPVTPGTHVNYYGVKTLLQKLISLLNNKPKYGYRRYGSRRYQPKPVYVHKPVYIPRPVYIHRPVYRRPVYQRPVYRRPVYQRPVYQRPVYRRPVYQVRPRYQYRPRVRFGFRRRGRRYRG